MRDGNSKKSKLSWTKTLFRKWLNIKGKSEDFEADDSVCGGHEKWRNSHPEEACATKKSRTEGSSRRSFEGILQRSFEFDAPQTNDTSNYRIFVATWNVAGKSPPNHLSLDDWLPSSTPADVYVLGFQEIVPLNAGNVLGTEDNGPAKKWLALIRKTLNTLPGTGDGARYHASSPLHDLFTNMDADFDVSTKQKALPFFHRPSFQFSSHSMRMDNNISTQKTQFDRRFSDFDQVMFGHRPSDYDPHCRWGSSDEEIEQGDSPFVSHYSPISHCGSFSIDDRDRQAGRSKYCLVASKQMVGIFLTVWVKSDLRDNVRNLRISCVGRGLMGYLGNKGAISISMSLHQTSFCFICSHLSSGQKEGDEHRRNADVMEILKKTRFPRISGMEDELSPQTVLEHDRIIWLGDLNYRIALSYLSAKALVEMHNWKALLENDQLRIEQRCGRVFEGWKEGKICFPPTYKYSYNSDRYSGDARYPKEKRRTPAWCDRILWYGRGLNQLSYVRGESRFSDHRPVCSVFLAEVESLTPSWIKKGLNYSSTKIEAEELLPKHEWLFGT
ncbi:type I inositol polyphosphate 5-phosphatase 4-like [Cucurbita moschata]|uniref:Type I inositol polyphosphate 5-phosphatase 4-like n=1 Tax=Cucurbita moschata TaxID=3662 RepID=A0A6J1EXT2_CUCMO|nr:type I inositol polyphosphate 5-phosphatase 4-like [Cucurbita moschata]